MTKLDELKRALKKSKRLEREQSGHEKETRRINDERTKLNMRIAELKGEIVYDLLEEFK